MSDLITVVGAGSRTAAALIPMILEETDYRVRLLSTREVFTHDPRVTAIRLDPTDRQAVKRAILDDIPAVIINSAATTNVDRCETDRSTCWSVNVDLVEHLARMCRVVDAHLVHMSTDYVFDGTKGPYSELDAPKPISYYGKSKLAAENAALGAGIQATVVRTNVLYGPSQEHPDFVAWILESIDARVPVKVVTDQYSNPTYIDDVAEAILRLVRRRRTGIYHVGGADYLSRYEFALRIAEVFKVPTTSLEPVLTDDLAQPARRPLRGGLITLKAEADLGMKFRGVQAGLASLRHSLYAKLQHPTQRRSLLP